MIIKMINQFGNKFECGHEEVPRYLDVFAVFETEEDQKNYESTLPKEAEFEKKQTKAKKIETEEVNTEEVETEKKEAK